jgi:hypothetical protein
MQQKGIDINQFLRNALNQRKNQIEQQKQQIETQIQTSYTPSKRHIPLKIKKLISLEHGKKCAHPNCQKTAENIHHEHHFSIKPSHNPRFLKPLCKPHHELAHADDRWVRRYT